jgi:hypothetical protein
MALDFNSLLPQLDRVIDEIGEEYHAVPGLILTEDDLKCLLYMKLTAMPGLSEPLRTQDRHIRGTPVHAEVSWYGENRTLCIKPDITIIEPENLSILHGYVPNYRTHIRNLRHPVPGHARRKVPPLPSKQFEFGGKAIIFELKFARKGMTAAMLRLVRMDFSKMTRLFEILDRRGEGNTVFAYMVVFNKYRESLERTAFGDFMREHGASHRHKILYKPGRLPAPRHRGDHRLRARR